MDVGVCEAPWFEDSAGRVQMVADDNEVCVRVRVCVCVWFGEVGER